MYLFITLASASFDYEDVYYALENKLHDGFPTNEELNKIVECISEDEMNNAMREAGYKIIEREINKYIKEVHNA